jgi:SAM-dependent methyltransferase
MNFSDKIRALPETMRPEAAPGTWESSLALLPGTGNVLHAGAGRGGISRILNDSGYRVTSLDLYPQRFLPSEIECIYADLNYPLQLPDAAFDVVLAVEVMEHLENPWGFFREAIRALKTDGVFIFSTPNVISAPSRLQFFFQGILPYFRLASFEGCHHVTPIFPWAVERCCSTTSARITSISYSRADWPRRDDTPRHNVGRGIPRLMRRLRRMILDQLPRNALTGEISIFCIAKTQAVPAAKISLME